MSRTTDLASFRSKRRLFVLPELKIAYVSVPKNACTSVKWLMAELAGENLDRIRKGGLGFNPTRVAQVHDRTTWQKLPNVAELDPAVRADVDPDRGWFVFGVLRDPRLRLFSAWQDKYLLRSPGYWQHWDDPAQPPVPTKAADIVDSFARFVDDVTSVSDHPALDDGHFVSQVHALDLDVVRYGRLYDMSELGVMTAELNKHVTDHGWQGGELELGRSNKSPFEPVAELFGGGVREKIERLYADDFELFGDRWDFSRIEGRDTTWTPDAFAHAQSIIAMSERMSDVVRSARRLRRQNKRLRARGAQLRSKARKRGRPKG